LRRIVHFYNQKEKEMKEADAGVKWFRTAFFCRDKYRAGRPVRYEDNGGVLCRLRFNNITLFTPWGPRYDWKNRGVEIKSGHREVTVLNFLAQMFNELRTNMPGKNIRWLFLGADLYGARINCLPVSAVGEYFASLAEWLRIALPESEFRLWSEFDKLAEVHRQYARNNFSKLVPNGFLAVAAETAKRFGSDPKIYIVERLAEARLMEELFRPIKISLVGRGKDHKVDADLPRLYLLPKELHAPWLKN
jgi:hypothetical protein